MTDEVQQDNLTVRFKKMIVMYLDIAIRGLISFCVVILFLLILNHYVKVNPIVMLVASFIISIFLAPLFSKVRLADKLFDKYASFLDRMIPK